MMEYMRSLLAKVEAKIRDFFSDESGEVNIVAIVVLIGIAVLLAIIFRDAISNLLDTLFDTIETNAASAIGTNSPSNGN